AAQLLANFCKAGSRQIERLGIAVKSDQMPRGSQLPNDAFGVSSKSQRAVHIGSAGPNAEEIQGFLKKNRHMAFIQVRHAHPLGGVENHLCCLKSCANDLRCSSVILCAVMLCLSNSWLCTSR